MPVGASDPRRLVDARCTSPLRDTTTLRHHPTRGPPPPSPPGTVLPTRAVQRILHGFAVEGAVAETPERRLEAANGVGPRRAGERDGEKGAKHVMPARGDGQCGCGWMVTRGVPRLAANKYCDQMPEKCKQILRRNYNTATPVATNSVLPSFPSQKYCLLHGHFGGEDVTSARTHDWGRVGRDPWPRVRGTDNSFEDLKN